MYFEVVHFECDNIVLDPISIPVKKRWWEFWKRSHKRLWVVEYDVQVRCTVEYENHATYAYDFTIPRGARTDLASIPRPLWWFMSPLDVGVLDPAVVHDWAYEGVLPREIADELLYVMASEYGLPLLKAEATYWSVRGVGWWHYKKPPTSHKAGSDRVKKERDDVR